MRKPKPLLSTTSSLLPATLETWSAKRSRRFFSSVRRALRTAVSIRPPPIAAVIAARNAADAVVMEARLGWGLG